MLSFFKPNGDPIIWAATIALLAGGCIMFMTNIHFVPNSHIESSYEQLMFFAKKHLIWVVIGLVVMSFLSNFNILPFVGFVRYFLLFGIVLILITSKYGVKEGDAARKLIIGGFSFSPAEFFKLIIIMYLSVELAIRQKYDAKNFKILHVLIPFFASLVALGLNSNSAMLIMTGTGLGILYIGRASFPFKYILITFVACFLLAIVLLVYEGKRAKVFIERIEDKALVDINRDGIVGANNPNPNELSQAQMAAIAVGTARIPFGTPGNSDMKDILPMGYSDYVYAVLIEEYGIFGGILVIFAYLVIFIRSIELVKEAKKAFGALMSVGYSLMIVTQAFLHILVNIDLFPTTGQTLPLISQGGTSIVAVCAGLGIMLNVSRRDYQETTAELSSNNYGS